MFFTLVHEYMARGHGTIRQALLTHIPAGSHLAVAVSGGKDSVVLLHNLAAIQKQKKLKLSVLHVNHSLRGKESDGDRAFVKSLAESVGANFYSTKLRSPPTKNIEAWARAGRYGFFETCRKKHDFTWIVTAHTANDLCETYLMRMLANKKLGQLTALDHNRHLLRPLLTIDRSSIDRYCDEEGLAWREDASNNDLHFLRNKIRKQVLPFLEEVLGKNQVLRLAEKLEDFSLLEQTIEGLASELLIRAELVRLPPGSRGWVTCLRNIINAIDYTCLKLAVVHLAFASVLANPKGVPSPKGSVRNQLHRSLNRVDCRNLLSWIERGAQAVTLSNNRVLRGKQGGFVITHLDR